MKYRFCFLILALALSIGLKSQVSELDNTLSNPASFIGWDAAATSALNINHKANTAASDLNFLTRNIQRMQLNDNGLLGLGLTTQTSLLHLGRTTNSLGGLLRTDGFSTEVTQWQLYTGTTLANGTEKFRLWTDALAAPWVNQTANNALGFRFETPSATGNATPLIRLGINGFKNNALINGFTVNTTGFSAFTLNNNLWNASGPASILSLSGSGTGNTPGQGYRPWMKDGITFFANSDMAYIGPVAGDGGVIDRTDFTLCWGDNHSGPPGAVGPDNMKFICTQGLGVATGYNDNLTGEDLDGREIMRLNGNGNGNVGIGPLFTNLAQPQADLHIHTEQNPLNISLASSSIQLSLESLTGATATDGFRISTEEIGNVNEDGTVKMQQFENNSIRISTAYADIGNPMGERMRITGITDLTVGNPGNLPLGTTRVSICSNGASPIKRTRSVLHLGTELDTDNDGWRKWMNVGTLSAQGDKHAYFGVRPPEVGDVNTEAVVSWGMSGHILGSGYQMPMRFIFSSDIVAGAGDETAGEENGREIARMMPNGHVGIGIQAPIARLHVDHEADFPTATNYGIRSRMYGGTGPMYAGYFSTGGGVSSATIFSYGVYAESQGGLDKNFGGYFNAFNSPNSTSSVGVYANSTSASSTSTNEGVYGNAAASIFNTGVRGKAQGINNNSALNIGVYGEATGTGTNWAMWAAGEVFTTGTGMWQTSDEMLKQNIQGLSNSLAIIDNLNPKTYEYRCDEYPQLNLSMGIHCGLIAQEVEAIMPEMVKDVTQPAQFDENGVQIADALTFKAINYNELHAIEIAAIKDLKLLVHTQQDQISNLQTQLNACCSTGTDTRSEQVESATIQEVNLSNKSIILNQNVPNPFAERTTISYSITEDFTKAQILFYDANGKLIQSTDITTKGAGQLNVFADDLSNGIYSYALVVDGKIIDTKKMVKQ